MKQVPVYYSPAFVDIGYEFDTTRKSQWIADSLSVAVIPGIDLVEPDPIDPCYIFDVHDKAYVESVATGHPKALAESQGFTWEERLWPMMLASLGGMVAAALSAMATGVSGSLSTGSHHAHQNAGEGFCTFNGLVIATYAALRAGAKNVLVLDLDAHCGGGTASLIANEARIHQLDVAVNSFDGYQSTDRVRLCVVRNREAYLRTIQQELQRLGDRARSFDLCLYNAGMDPYEGCTVGGLQGITEEMLSQREALVFNWCRSHGLPIAFFLAGGYTGPRLPREKLVDLHRLTLKAAMNRDARARQ